MFRSTIFQSCPVLFLGLSNEDKVSWSRTLHPDIGIQTRNLLAKSLVHYQLSYFTLLKSNKIVFEIKISFYTLFTGSKVSDKNRSIDVAGNMDGRLPYCCSSFPLQYSQCTLCILLYTHWLE